MSLEMAVPVVAPSAFACMSPVMILPAPLLSFLSSFVCQGGGILHRVLESYHVRSFPISRGRFECSQHKLLHLPLIFFGPLSRCLCRRAVPHRPGSCDTVI